ncbi:MULTISPECIES: SPFH domain-containing protein [unclassified Streptosporangium]|uniref:SPFH domain-containing protein n=1 Tax=unclassified Streptosporangium TaxID=2632669 RepID=UPI002E2C2AFB|nr:MULTISPECIES: SPFH domain-containing protein [unclassified Streptosporangium]
MSIGKSVAAVVFAVIAVIALISVGGGFERTEPGQVAVVRDGGPLDDSGIRQVIPPDSGLTWVGLWSSVHSYPSQQRIYTITTDAKRASASGVDEVTVPSSDGVNLGIEGTLYFTLNLDQEMLKRFDDRYGTRTYLGQDGESRYAWDGDEGWNAFFIQSVRPVIYNALRSQIGAAECAELLSSCSLVQTTSNKKAAPAVPAVIDSNASITRAQNGINQLLERDLEQLLGGRFFTGLRFTLVRVTLPPEIQAAVNKTQVAQAGIAEAAARASQADVEAESKIRQAEADAKASVALAKGEAKANKELQESYRKCRACVEIDKLNALPDGITVYAPGNSDLVVPAK